MSLVLVTGGTGHLGRDLVPALLASGRRVRLLSGRPGNDDRVEWAQGDLATGAGIEAALDGADCVVHAATFSPIARRGLRFGDFFRSPADVDVTGTARLLEASKTAGVSHFLYVSIVGLERSPLPYARVKLAGERLVRQSDLPWSVVRACPFYYLVAQTLESMRPLPVWPVPDPRTNPVDTRDVAEHLVACLGGAERGMLAEIGGPETMGLAEFARQYRAAHRLSKPVLPVPVTGRIGAALGFNVAEGVAGRRSWSQWLAEQQDRSAARA